MKNVLFTALIVAAAATTSWAQTPETFPETVPLLAQAAPAPPPAQAPRTVQVLPAQPAPPAPPATPAAPAPAAQGARIPRNVRFDIVITETGPKPGSKTVSLTVSDLAGQGSVRNTAKAPGDSAVSLNVDVRQVQWYEPGVVRASINVEYQPYTPDVSAPSSGVIASAMSMFQDGRRTQILQTTDPLSDRRTTVEVTATFLK